MAEVKLVWFGKFRVGRVKLPRNIKKIKQLELKN